ncbi:MAG: glycosyltransferase family 10 [Sideroxydans sp.]|nr:glycosyltransferase family 10 [Sideroxydans sp.]
MKNINSHNVLIDPSSEHYYRNGLFDLKNPRLNRDGTLLPFYRVKTCLEKEQGSINTVDLLLQGNLPADKYKYISLGILTNIAQLELRNDVELSGFIIMEPPVVDPELYAALPDLVKKFDYVYLHNVIGDGYSLKNVDQSKLKKLYWPQPNLGVLNQYWCNTNRQNRIVVINGSHRPKNHKGELYSKRIDAMASLSRLGVIDLYGRGWRRWWSRSAFWLPYWMNRAALMNIFQGECDSKYEVLSKYDFCLCFENMTMSGYVTEKIFDCFYAGAIPLYWGAPDINTLIPPDSYIDVRGFSSWESMWNYLKNLTVTEKNKIREAGRLFLQSPVFLNYFDSLEKIVCAD